MGNCSNAEVEQVLIDSDTEDIEPTNIQPTDENLSDQEENLDEPEEIDDAVESDEEDLHPSKRAQLTA